jgi:hypothetical protein
VGRTLLSAAFEVGFVFTFWMQVKRKVKSGRQWPALSRVDGSVRPTNKQNGAAPIRPPGFGYAPDWEEGDRVGTSGASASPSAILAAS